ncbi:hypothetical protein [Candidatus Mycobacterium methanotrophicum]|uniref:Uncharacterized protein n=1 Tax=Candidatus Mycobacterium methanotrophicum TaxID=2943498 RepID=A0ABY4QST2_9MYCO|nr:hypothetical protein [Candidatus Mycobacterium methanotrophicum]UQX13403.1 hypothetical protein M5I08_24640 [Candidatus Mycobacterium methanotrophicum]
MSVGSAEVLPAVFGEEDTIDEQPLAEYLWSDLKIRRAALSLWPEDLAPLLGMDETRYRAYETGGRTMIGRGLINEIVAMEAFVVGEVALLIDGAPAEGTVVLQAVVDQQDFVARYPHARTVQHRKPYPVSLQYVAVGRAAAVLSRRDREVEVYRGERHFDLTAGRLAVGLGKTETAYLLGLNKKSYYAAERGTEPPRYTTMDELQALDDFINDTAVRFEVTAGDGVSTIWVTDDQAEFEKTYPEARFERSNTPYPVRALHVAAARRIHALDAAGQPARIAVDDK